MKKRILAILTSVLLVLTTGPLSLIETILAEGARDWTVPEGYNADDYNAIASFLEIENEWGQKNGTAIRPEYDPNDPSTWLTVAIGEEDEEYHYGVFWVEIGEGEDAELRVDVVALPDYHDPYFIPLNPSLHGMVGTLDVRCCEYLRDLNVQWTCVSAVLLPHEIYGHFNFANTDIVSVDLSECSRLMRVSAWDCPNLISVDLSGCALLETVDLDTNPNLTSIDITGLYLVKRLSIYDNNLAELDLSSCNELVYLMTANTYAYGSSDFIDGNMLKTIDLSNCPLIPYDLVEADGAGYIGAFFNFDPFYAEIGLPFEAKLLAEPEDGAAFLGWYDSQGELLSSEELIDVMLYSETEFYARFSETLVGDIDGDGIVTINDALTALRYGMELIDLSAEQLEAGDMNGDGIVDLVDALLILRTAMGVI